MPLAPGAINPMSLMRGGVAPGSVRTSAVTNDPGQIPGGNPAPRGPAAPTAATFAAGGPWSASGGVGVGNARDARQIAGAGWGTSGGVGASGGTLPNGGIYSQQFGTLGSGQAGGVVGARGVELGGPAGGANNLSANTGYGGAYGGGAGGVAGNAFGGGGGYSGAGGQVNNLGNTLQNAQNSANAANDARYNQLLGLATNLSSAATQRETIRANNLTQRVDQNAIGAGLGNTTILPTLERGVADDSAIRQEQVADQGLKTEMGIIERRTDQQPNLGLAASLASRPGASGQLGYGGPGSVNPLSGGAAAGGSPLQYAGQSYYAPANPATGYADTGGFTNNSGPSSPNALNLTRQAQATAARNNQTAAGSVDSSQAILDQLRGMYGFGGETTNTAAMDGLNQSYLQD